MPTREKVIKKLLPYYVVETVQMVKSVKVFEFLASASSDQHYIEFSNNIKMEVQYLHICEIFEKESTNYILNKAKRL